MMRLFFVSLLLCGSLGPAWTSPAFADNGVVPVQSSTAADLQRELQRIDAELDQSIGPDAQPVEFSFGQAMQWLVMTAFVCLLAYLLLGKLLPMFLRMNPAMRRSMAATMPQGLVEVMDRLPLDARRSVYVFKVKNECFLVGCTEQSMTMLSKLDLCELEAEGDDAGAKNFPGLSRFAGILKKQSSKETSV
jgi:flagellar protein FliO/FliZ